jgi:serine/threonine-protein kinase RsbW
MAVPAATTLEIPADVARLAEVRRFVREWLSAQLVPAAATGDVVQAVDECATNAIVHGYQGRTGSVQIELEVRGDTITAYIRDQARPFNPTLVPEPAYDRPIADRLRGGMGVHLMRAALDEMRYRLLPDGRNEMTMIRRIDRVE